MNYRTRPAEHICSLEDLFINYLGLDIPIVPQTSSYSNKHTFSQLFFTQNTNQCDDIDKILSFSVFKDSSLEKLKAAALSPRQPSITSSIQMRVTRQALSWECSFPTWQTRTTAEMSSLLRSEKY